jgi:hypothetical protein
VCVSPASRIDGAGPRRDETPLCVVYPRGVPLEPPSRIRFGDWLVRRRLITSADLFTALHDAFLCSCRVGDVLVMRGVMQRNQVEEEARAYESFSAF